jgi:glycosyltransferase involved in cell wall biosynthesis
LGLGEKTLGRPTIALCCILKNEVNNLPRLLASVKGCFDVIHLTDTGSSDGSIELIQSYATGANPSDTPIQLHHFPWVDDFAAARNASYRPAETDYVAWLDLDDVLSGREAFIQWRDTIMEIAEYWVATYHYASDATGKPVCSFARERVIKRGLGLEWRYFVHEGIIPVSPYGRPIQAQYATAWNVVHVRSEADVAMDRSRNLNLFKNREKTLDPRMQYYYGKELFENGKPLEAFEWLVKASAEEKLELHDRILAIQYACLSAQQCNQYDRSIMLAHQGLQLAPGRAEFFNMIGDAYVKANRFGDSVPYYSAAKECAFQDPAGLMAAPLFIHEDAYKFWPRHQLAKVFAQLGQFDRAEHILNECDAIGANGETTLFKSELKKLKPLLTLPSGLVAKSDDIVISCHGNGFYEWDEEIAKTQGVGGSEIAVIRMARELHKLTGRTVRVFNNRTQQKEIDGVFYHPAHEASPYFQKFEPKIHFAWRHATKLTNAPTYVWCHDLMVPGIEHHQNYDGVLTLSKFHKNYVHSLFRVPLAKLSVTKNGIDPERFSTLPAAKEDGRVVFSSSPDRGLARAIEVMDLVIPEIPWATLHCYYGFENMIKIGRASEVDALKALIKDRPYVKFHGNLPQDQLAVELGKACVWLYPTNFLETFCITALEMQAAKVYSVVRRWGALPERFEFEGKANATILDSDCETLSQGQAYAKAVVKALKQKSWGEVAFNPEDHSWHKVALEWVERFSLSL